MVLMGNFLQKLEIPLLSICGVTLQHPILLRGFDFLSGRAGKRDGGGQFDFLAGRAGKKKRASSASDRQGFMRLIVILTLFRMNLHKIHISKN